jgi:hypothetical protein
MLVVLPPACSDRIVVLSLQGPDPVWAIQDAEYGSAGAVTLKPEPDIITQTRPIPAGQPYTAALYAKVVR